MSREYHEHREKKDVNELETKVREMIGEKTMPSIAQMYVKEGKIEGKTESIFAILEARFGRVPSAIHDAVTQITDIGVLGQLVLLATKCETLEEFEEKVML